MEESKEELKSVVMKVKEESEKVGLNSTFRKLRSWHLVSSLHGKLMGKQTMETVRDFIFLGSKITADGDSSHEMKRHLLLGRKALKKQRHYFTNKGPSSQSYSFSSSHVRM